MARPRKHALPSIEVMRDILDYDPATGEFRHKARPLTTRNASQWNSRWAGKVAGSVMNGGYWFLCIKGQYQLGHRVAWAMYHGSWPGELDHKDNNKLNNAIDNLRPATHGQNSQNRAGWSISGFKGVYRSGGCANRWYARIMIDYRAHYLGSFGSREEAHEAYKKAALDKHKGFANFDIIRVGTIAATISFAKAA